MRLNKPAIYALLGVAIVMGTVAAADHGKSEGGPTADSALAKLKKGNVTFRLGKYDHYRTGIERRLEVAKGQHPFATILTCADSRVPPELVFDQGLGDLFVVRTAGGVPDQAVLGSIEYAAEHLHVPLVVVLGHTSCGAVKAAMESKEPAKADPHMVNLERLLSSIRPSLPGAGHGDAWTNAVYSSVDKHTADVTKFSPILKEMTAAGKVKIVGAVYELESGKVDFEMPVKLEKNNCPEPAKHVATTEHKPAEHKAADHAAADSHKH